MIDKSKLSGTARASLEAYEFQLANPHFYPTERNWATIYDYISRHKMPKDRASFEKAYAARYSEILNKEESIALMSGAELKNFAETWGRPRYDATTGKLLGHDFPDEAPPPEPVTLTQRSALGHTITAKPAPKVKERIRQTAVTRALGDFLPR